MKRRRTLITSPLKWQMTAAPVEPPVHPIFAERGGTQLNTPRPVVVIDSREQNPFSFDRFAKWFSGVERRALPLGDYSIRGMEETCTVERKELSDLMHSLSTERPTFLNRLRQMSLYPQRLLIITAAARCAPPASVAIGEACAWCKSKNLQRTCAQHAASRMRPSSYKRLKPA